MSGSKSFAGWCQNIHFEVKFSNARQCQRAQKKTNKKQCCGAKIVSAAMCFVVLSLLTSAATGALLLKLRMRDSRDSSSILAYSAAALPAAAEEPVLPSVQPDSAVKRLDVAFTMSMPARLGMKRSLGPEALVGEQVDASERARFEGVLESIDLRADALRSQRVVPVRLLPAVARPARASNSARSAAEVGFWKEDILVCGFGF